MANELTIDYPTGATLYAYVLDATGQVWNGVAFEAPQNANWGNYDIALTEAGTTGVYRGNMPAVAAGLYSFVVRLQAGGAPAVGDASVGTGQGVWNGSAFVPFVPSAGANEFTYTVTDSVTGLPIEGVDVWCTTDIAGLNVGWRGTTDAFGVARDTNNNKPLLDTGTWYFWSQKAGYTFSNPDAEAVP